MQAITIFWFRRDLRLEDNAGLYHALSKSKNVLPIFIFDTTILNKLEDKNDKRVAFIHDTINQLQQKLVELGSSLLVKQGAPLDVFKQLIKEFAIKSVYTNHDYEPAAIERDRSVELFLQKQNISFNTFKDQVIFEKDEVLKDDGTPYTVFTPYSRKWKTKLNAFYTKSYPSEKYIGSFLKMKPCKMISLGELGFTNKGYVAPEKKWDPTLIKAYAKQRDFPALNATSRLSVHLRFGTISIRKLVRSALKLSDVWLNELIWREFYMMILFHYPHVVNGAFKKKYDRIPWRNNELEFEKWCKGETGYPIVDAGMRELNETGFMHNRVRMIVASFLVKHLLIDWRWGEAYFAKKLLDFELASNNGGWQWAASSGCDAAPYFRIFNPYEQTKRFDPKNEYINIWVPDIEDVRYDKPIVDHKFARDRVLKVFKDALA